MIQSKQQWQYKIIDGKHVINSEYVVHRFEVAGYEDDPVVVAGAPLYEWGQSEAGKWVKEHALEMPRWERFTELYNMGHKFAIIARLTEQDYTFFTLKFK